MDLIFNTAVLSEVYYGIKRKKHFRKALQLDMKCLLDTQITMFLLKLQLKILLQSVYRSFFFFFLANQYAGGMHCA